MKVTTINKESIDSSLCRKIGENYYKIGDPKIENSGDVYKIGGKYVRFETGTLFYDYEIGQYRKKSEVKMMINHCIVLLENKKTNPKLFESLNEEDQKTAIAIKIRPAEYNPEKMVKTLIDSGYQLDQGSGKIDFIHDSKTGDRYLYALNADILTRAGFKRSLAIDAFVPEQHDSSHDRIGKGKKENYDNNFDLNSYGSEGNAAFERSKENFKNTSKNFKISPVDRDLSNLLKGLSFGVEIESSGGYIPSNDLFKYGFIPVRDGSIDGHEFISIPYKGPEGIHALSNVFKIASKHLTVNEMCSLHYHFGNFKPTYKNVVALYMLSTKIQQEIFELMPPYKKDGRFLAIKRGNLDHCRFLPELGLYNPALALDQSEESVKQSFINIATFFNDGAPVKLNDDGKIELKHAREGSNKWDYRSRYHWINFIPWIFKKQKTVEFRAHSGTANPIKALNWLLICAAILIFTEKNADLILARKKFNITDILGVFSEVPFVHDYLIEYVNERKENHYKLKMKDDIYGDEFANDSNFKFVRKYHILNYI